MWRPVRESNPCFDVERVVSLPLDERDCKKLAESTGLEPVRRLRTGFDLSQADPLPLGQLSLELVVRGGDDPPTCAL